MIEIAHGDCSLVEHSKFTRGRYEVYITRYGESGRHRFETMDELREYLKSFYGFTDDMIHELYNTRNIT